MAVAIRQNRRCVTHRPLWMRQRETEPGATLALGMMALVAVVIACIVVSGQLLQVTIPRFVVQLPERSLPTRPIDGATPVTKLSAAAVSANPAVLAAPQAAPDVAPAPSALAAGPAAPPQALATGSRARVANTDGVGVVLYGAPRPSARQPAGLLEGTLVTVLELSGAEWARVQADNRQAGWVHAEFLAPAS